MKKVITTIAPEMHPVTKVPKTNNRLFIVIYVMTVIIHVLIGMILQKMFFS